MDVVDAQFHLGPGRIDATLGAMDALGIDSMLIEEFWFDPKDLAAGNLKPGYRLANGAWRAIYPNAELASILDPDRFSFCVRIDRRDHRLDSVMRTLGESPFARGFRVLATWNPEEAEGFAAGAYDELFEIAQDIGMPVCLFIPGEVHRLPRYLARFPGLTFVVDHCGLPNATRPADDAPAAYFDRVLDLAEHPNVVVKWSHTQRHFNAPDYPYEPVRPFLRRAIEAFGADRLLWASDASIIPDHSWSNLLNYLRDDPELSQDEKEWILGRTSRRVFDWPVGSASTP